MTTDPITRVERDASVWGMFGALTLIWGASFLFIHIGLDAGLQPVALVTWRMTFATLFLVTVLLLTRSRLPNAPGALRRIAVLGVLNAALPNLLITWGQQWIPTALASVLNGLQPLFTIVIAALVLHDEPITLNRLTGLVLGFVGAILLVSPNLGGTGPDVTATQALLGELAVIGAAASYAVAAVYARRVVTRAPIVIDPVHGPRRPTPVEIALPQIGTAAVIMLVLAVLVERPPGGIVGLPPTLAAWLAVAWLGALGSGLAYILYFGIMRVWGATRTSLVTYALPVVGITLGVLLLDEQLHPEEIAGTTLVLAGLVLANARVGHRVLFGRTPPAP
ncbi:MAG: DMT family transporter [Chloroflexi bacterium]|nr:DMT family transporter [Chloroflexota bacterium]